MYIVSLSWSSECYNTHWTEKFKSHKKAKELYLTTLKNQAKNLTAESLEDNETLQKDFKEWNKEDSEFKLMTEKEIDECTCGHILYTHIEESLNFKRIYMGSNEQFDIIFE